MNLTGDQIVTYVLGAFALLLGILALTVRSERWLYGGGALLGAAGALCAHYDAFWGMAILAVAAISCAIVASGAVDLSWRVRGAIVFAVTALSALCLWPTLTKLSSGRIPLPEYVAKNVDFQIVPGLDLRGGLRLVYTVDVHEAIRDRRDRRYEEMRLELAKIYADHQGDDRPTEETLQKLRSFVTLEAPKAAVNEIKITIAENADPAKVDARFLDLFSSELSYSRSEDQRVLEFRIKEASESDLRQTAVAQAKEIILRRVDSLGLREASVSTRDEDIIIEVPGEDEHTFEEIRKIVSQTARLEFKLLDDDTDFFGELSKKTTLDLPEGLDFRAESVPVGQSPDGELRRKVSTYAFMKKQEGESIRDTLVRFKEWSATLELPEDRELGYEIEYQENENTGVRTEAGWRTYLLKSRAEITGDLIRDAQATPDTGRSALGGWYVALAFTDAGGAIFERITGENIKRRFAIILDDRVESAPVIQTKIPGGHASITMGGANPEQQLKDSRNLELVLRSGALPAPITPSNEQRIGPSLGQTSISLGMRGALMGSLAVICFMVLYYRKAGIIADMAVALNLFLQLAILATFNASMTLPGIAGLALTIGMSVDANVLITERIREELREGRSPRAAVELGFNRALSAIFDGNITTVISAIVLAQFGSGPIKGFAVTLMVGVTTNLFTGVVVSRWLFDFWVRNMSREARLDVG
jgi:preprotein translocase subunit SecD